MLNTIGPFPPLANGLHSLAIRRRGVFSYRIYTPKNKHLSVRKYQQIIRVSGQCKKNGKKFLYLATPPVPVANLSGNSKKAKRQVIEHQSLAFYLRWDTRTRTKNDRTRICSVTITPYPNVFTTRLQPHCVCKVTAFFRFSKINWEFFHKKAKFKMLFSVFRIFRRTFVT